MAAQLPLEGAWTATAALNWASSAVVQAQSQEVLITDAESRELRLTVSHGISDRWAIQLQLPYRYVGGGVLDNMIDSWHELFGLSEGARGVLADDRTQLLYARSGRRLLRTTQSETGLGNLSIDLGRRLFSALNAEVTSWLSVKLPISAFDTFGSDTVDVSLIVAGARRFAGRWSVFGQASATYMDQDNALGSWQRQAVYAATAGVSARAWPSLDLTLQVDAHTGLLDSQVDFLSDTAILTLGGSYRFHTGWSLDIGISEDIAVDRSPDVAFVIGVRNGF